MGKFSEYIGFQFGNPRGVLGRIVCMVMNVINKKMYNSIVGKLKLNEKSKILEIGYGNGYLINMIYKKFKPTIYGIDISADAKKLASSKNRKISSDKLFLDVGDCCELEYTDNIFDSVVTMNTIYFWNDVEKGLAEIYRILKPNGMFYNVVYSKEWLEKLAYTQKGFKLFYKSDFIKMGRKAGFKGCKIVEIDKEKSYMIIYLK